MRRFIGPAVTVICAAGLLGLFVFGLASQGDSRSLDSAVAAGKRPAAPDRTLPLLSGQGSRSLASWRGHVVVLNFWASWCTPCEQEARVLEQAQQQLTGSGGTVVGVTWRDASPDSQAFVSRHALTYPNLRDVDGSLAKDYGTSALPETFVLDAKGRVVKISRGEVNSAWLSQAVAQASSAT